MQRNLASRKWKFFLSKVRPQSRRRQGGDGEFNSLSNYHKFRWRIWVWKAEETEKEQNFINADEFTFHKFKIFLIKNSYSEYNKMQNWILFQTATNSDREFGSERQKKMKNKGN